MLNAMKLANSVALYVFFLGVVYLAGHPEVYGQWKAKSDIAYEKTWADCDCMEPLQ